MALAFSEDPNTVAACAVYVVAAGAPRRDPGAQRSDVGAVRYLLSISGQEQQPPAAPVPIGALNRYDRPQPSLEDYDRLRPNWVATEAIQ